MFRFPRVLLAVLSAFFALSCPAARAQDLFGNNPPSPRPAQRAPAAASAVEKHFNKGLQLMQQRKLDQAIVEFQAAKKLQPKQPAILVNLGLCYMQKRNLPAAESAFREVIALDPNCKTPPGKFAIARLVGVLSAQGKHTQGIAMAKKYVAVAPKEYDSHFSLGVCYLGAKNFSGAASAFKSALAIKPNDPAATQNLGYSLLNSKDYPAARKFFERELARKDNAQFRAMVAYACEMMGDKKAALAHYDKLAWKRLPNSPLAVMSMVRIHNSLNKPDEAAKVLKKAATVYKKDYAINAEMGRIYMTQGKYKEAEAALLAARKVKSDVYTNTNLAVVEMNLQKPANARMYAEAAVKLEPKNTQAMEMYAYVLNASQKSNEAVAVYRKWEKHYPKDPSANQKIAGIYLMQGKGDDAYKEYEKAMKKAPKSPAIMVSAASALRTAGKIDQAIALLQKAHAIDPKYGPAMSTLAEIYESQSKTDLAIEQYKKLVALYPKSKQYIQRLAQAYDTKKDYTAEIEQYRKLCELDPKDVGSAVTIARIYDKAGKLDEALAEIKKVVEANPKDDSAHVFYGDMLVKKQDYAAAMTQYETLTKSEDVRTKSYGYFKMAETHEKQGKHEEAIAAYKTCIDGMPSNRQALDALAKVYADQKKSDEFLAYVKTKVEAGTDDSPYDYYVTKCKEANKADEAVKTLEPIAAKNVANKTLQMQLAEAYKAAGQGDKAIGTYKSLVEKNKDDLMLEMGLCELYKSLDKNEEAIEALKALTKKVPDYAKLHADLGDLYVKINRKAEAEVAYRAALKLQPSNQQFKDKLSALTNPPPPPPPPAPNTQPAAAPAPTPAPATPATDAAPATAPAPDAASAPK